MNILKREPGFYKRLFCLSLPMVLQNLITFSLGLIDTFMVSQLGNEEDAVEIVDERLVNGEWQIYRRETFYPRDPTAEAPWQDAYEQSEILYVEDGYWDL